MTAFTTKATGLLRELRSRVKIGLAFNPGKEPEPALFEFQAIWDTGATNSVITQRVVDLLGLQPISMVQVHTANGTNMAEVFLVALSLPNRVGFNSLRVSKADLVGEDMLIGMDVISCGDFSVTNFQGKTVFTYRHPSEGDIDFVTRPAAPVPSAQPGNREQRRADAKAKRRGK